MNTSERSRRCIACVVMARVGRYKFRTRSHSSVHADPSMSLCDSVPRARLSPPSAPGCVVAVACCGDRRLGTERFELTLNLLIFPTHLFPFVDT